MAVHTYTYNGQSDCPRGQESIPAAGLDDIFSVETRSMTYICRCEVEGRNLVESILLFIPPPPPDVRDNVANYSARSFPGRQIVTNANTYYCLTFNYYQVRLIMPPPPFKDGGQ